MTAPLVTINGPVPVASRYGLLSVAQIVDDADTHWLNGGIVWPYPPGGARFHDQCAAGSTSVKIVSEDAELSPFRGYLVYVGDECTSRSVGDVDEFKARLVASLTATEGPAVEQELAMGVGFGDDPHLTDTSLDQLNSGAATSPENGLALLERAIGRTRKAGVIHADPATVTAWAARHLIVQGSTKLTTMLGTPVASGDGYIDARPDGDAVPADCLGWAFATGPVQIRRTAPFVNPPDIAAALARSTNDVAFFAERGYLHTWDRELQAGVLIDRDITGC